MGQAIRDSIESAIGLIVRQLDPERVVLFGSRARGTSRPNSDIDLLVIADSRQPRFRRAVGVYQAIADLPGEFDVIVYTPEEVDEWREVPQAFVTTALREGQVVYEKQA
jgi:predicted nucleotidyltransferase